MSSFVRIRDSSELDAIHDLIHDCFFAVDDVTWDEAAGILTFKFRKPVPDGRILSWKHFVSTAKDLPAVVCYLRIYHVESYTIRDTEKVGSYDFNILEYNPDTCSMRVLTGIPIDIRIRMEDFEVSVEETDTILSPS